MTYGPVSTADRWEDGTKAVIRKLYLSKQMSNSW